MTSRGSIQTSNSSFSDPLTVHPWKVLVDNICENLDDNTFEKFILFSKNVLGQKKCDELFECKSRVKYFSSLEDCCGEDGAVAHIEHIVSIDEFHGNLGQTDYRDEIKKYKEEKQHYLEECAKKGLSIDPDFVGREILLVDIITYLQGNYKGVVLCGMGGVGKTALAGQICYRMKYGEAKWIIIPINQRENESPKEFLLDLVIFLGTELNVDEELLTATRTLDTTEDTNVKCQLQSLFDIIEKDRKNVLFLVDNIDGMVDREDRKQEFCQQMREILNMLSNTVRVKFLLTSRIKMSKPTEHSKDKVHLFNKRMLEIELKSLNEEDTARMLRRLSRSTEEILPDSICNQIFSLCDGIPLAISIVAAQIKDGIPVHRLIGYMQSQSQSSCLNSIMCQTLDKIASIGEGSDLKKFLIRLTIFDTAAFDLKACTAIGKQKSQKYLSERESFGYPNIDNTAEEDKRWIQLTKLKSYFLLEVDRTVRYRRHHETVKETYSLHPIVHDYLKSLYRENESLHQERETAKHNFLGHFYKLIQKRGEKCDKSAGENRDFVDGSKVHLRNWFTIFSKEKLSLKTYIDEEKNKKSYLVTCICVLKMAKLVLDHREKAFFAAVQADIAKSEKNLFPYMFWTSVEAECKIMDSRMQLAEELLDKVATELGVVSNETQCAYTSDWDVTLEDETPAWFKFYSTKSLLYHRLCRNENKTTLLDRALQVVTIADELFSRNENRSNRKLTRTLARYLMVDRADVKNIKGCIYFLKRDLDAAKRWHQSAFDVLYKYNDRHASLMQYQANIASCDHQLGLRTPNLEERDRLLDEALRKYSILVGKNKSLFLNNSLSQAGLLKNRADIYYIQLRFDNALSDGKHTLDIMTKHYRPPHIDITLALERVAHYHLKIGKQKKKDLDEEGERHLEEAINYYDQLLTYITKGGLPIEHNNGRTFRTARDNHIKALKLLKYSKKGIHDRLRKYQDFQDGKYNRNIQQNLLQDKNSVSPECLRELRESGATFMPQKIDSDPESDSDSTEESDTESSTEPSVSDSAESPDSDTVDTGNVRNEPQVLRYRRKDSGIEEEDIHSTYVLEGENRSQSDVYITTDPAIPLDENRKQIEAGVCITSDSNIPSGENCSKSEAADSVAVELHKSLSDEHKVKVSDSGSKSLTKRSLLKRQVSIDLPEMEMSNVTEVIENKNLSGLDIGICESSGISDEPSTSTSMGSKSVSDSAHESCSSAEGGKDMFLRSVRSNSSTRRDTWTSCESQDSTFGDVDSSEMDSFDETDKCRTNLLSSGSQSSVTTKMGKMLKLDIVGNRKDNSDNEEPAPKQSKLDLDTS